MKKLLAILLLLGIVFSCGDDTFTLENGTQVTPVCFRKISDTLYYSEDADQGYEYANAVPFSKDTAINLNTYTFKDKCSKHNREVNAYFVLNPDKTQAFIFHKDNVNFRTGMMRIAEYK